MPVPDITVSDVLHLLEQLAEESGDPAFMIALVTIEHLGPGSIRRAHEVATLARASTPQLLAELARRGIGDS